MLSKCFALLFVSAALGLESQEVFSTNVQEPHLVPIVYPLSRQFNHYEAKNKRQMDAEKEEETISTARRVPFPTDKVKQLLRILSKPKKSEKLKLNGWSASGMPFNVLYTPNTLNQKYLSSFSNVQERKALPTQTVTQTQVRENYQLAERKDQERMEFLRSGPKPPNRLTQLRKHYLVIPQLFVSYGWGSLGK